MYTLVKIQPLPQDRYQLLSDFTFMDVVVPKGYITNGADVPRIFWSVFPPNKSDYLPAVILHDYLCELGDTKRADNVFEIALEALEIGTVSRFVLVASVRAYHWVMR